MKIKERIEKYSSSTNLNIIPKVPVAFSLNINNFSRLNLDKPFDTKFSDAVLCTMIKLCNEIEGCVFAYNFLDEIILISRNDQSNDTLPWYDNNVQKLASITASIASVEFNKVYGDDIYFNSHVFSLPNMVECSNFISSKQHQYTQKLLNNLVHDHLQISLEESLTLTIEDKVQLLEEKDVHYNSFNSILRKGCAVYRKKDRDKLRWYLDRDVPVFLHSKDFLYSIFLSS